MKILAIETSCDETAAAVIEKNGKDIRILSNVVASQIKIHQKYGGVFPEIASRAHAEKIIAVVEQALGKIKPDIIAVTVGPGLIGSLLVGTEFAKTYAYANKLPILGINHLLGHIYSCFAEENVIRGNSGVIHSDSLSSNKSRAANHNQSQPITFPAIFLIVSGGHTGLYLMKSHKDIKTLGETLDDAAGEAFDKVAKMLQLGYPGGPAISKAASKFLISKSEFLNKSKIPNIKFPRSMLDRSDYNFSFSGLKTAVLYVTKKLQSQGITINHYKSLIAYEFEQTVIDILIGKTLQAAQRYKPKSICLCGGVSANQNLREQFKYNTKNLSWEPTFLCPPMAFTTDNAAMIGLAAVYQLTTHNSQLTTYDKIKTDANLKL